VQAQRLRAVLAPPFLVADAKARHWRKLTMLKILDWLELHPGSPCHGNAGIRLAPAWTGISTGVTDAGRPEGRRHVRATGRAALQWARQGLVS
jgi:hypothetical protein